VNLLLDTHVALWAVTDHPKLTPRARTVISDPRSTVWVSSASIWEIAIKHSRGRGDMPVSGRDAAGHFARSGYSILHVDANHAAAVEDLPWHHSDPFDRLLVAQALLEPMILITHDAAVARYSDTIIRI
jgi:PIN domain nuclease of toxin-antitoxin system